MVTTKVLTKKLKKVSKVQRLFYFVTILAYLATFIYFIYGILHLKGIETTLRMIAIIIFAVWFAIYSLAGLLCMLSKKKKTFIFLTIITLIFCPIFGVSSYYINKVYGALENINHEKILYTSNMIALKETKFNSSSVIGMIESEDDIEGNNLAKKIIKNNNLSNKIETYEDYQSMLKDLYNKKIDACFVSSNYAILFGQDDAYPNIANDVKVLYEYSEEQTNKDAEVLKTSSKKDLTEPFTMLIMGVDSEKNGLTANQAFNGDTLIMVTFNPSTLTATMFSIPRDMYVPIACNNNRYAKINSSAAYGSSCVISTIKQLTKIDIDYYVKMNFQGVVDLVDALGGVSVDVEEPDFSYDNKHIDQVCEQNSKRQFGSNLVCMKTGVQQLNGEQALAYARCRHLYAISDIARNKHQQDIIEAMAQKVKTLRSVKDFENILTAVSNNLETNMTTQQILSIYNVGKDMLQNTTSSSSISIKKTYLAYYSLPVYLPASGSYTSALGYYPQSLEAIVKAMKINLGQETEKPVKTFKINYNEDYTTPLIGQGLTGGAKLERMPNFIGYDRYYVSSWCSKNGISCSFREQDSSRESGEVVDQAVHEGVLLKSLSSATFYVSNGRLTTIIDDDDDDDDDTPSNNNNSNNSSNNSSNSSGNSSNNNSSNNSNNSSNNNSSSSDKNNNSSSDSNKDEDKKDDSSSEISE